MRLLSLKLVQWRSFERCELDLPDGLIGVVGSNGSGKTTLAEAIGWALFGRLRPGSKVSETRRQGSGGERSVVELVFRLSDIVYRVERVVGGSARLWIGDCDEPETVAVRATNARLVGLLDMTWETFERTVFARQKDVAALDPAGSADTRRRHVERLLGLERYRVAAEQARRRVKDLDVELRVLRDAAPDPDSLRAERDLAADAAAGSDPAVREAAGTLRNTTTAFADVEQHLEDARRATTRHAELSRRREQVTAAVAQLTTRLAARREQADERAVKVARLAALDGRGEDAAELAAARRAWDDLHERHVALETARARAPTASFDPKAAGERRARLAAVRFERDELRRTPPPPAESLQQRVDALACAEQAGPVERARALLDELDAQYHDVTKRIAVLDADVRRDREHLEAIEQTGPAAECSVCLRPYGEDFGPILQAHRGRIDDNAAALVAGRTELQACDGRRGLASAKHKAAERAAEAVARTSGPSRLADARGALADARVAAAAREARLAGLAYEQGELEPAVDAEARAERATAEHRGRLAECEAQLRTALAGLGIQRYDSGAHSAAVTRHEEAAAARDLRLKLRSEIEASTGIDEELSQLEAELSAAVAERDHAGAELAALNFEAGREQELRRRRDEVMVAKDTAIERLAASRAAAQARDLRVRDLTDRLEAAQAAWARIAERERSLREHDVAAQILTDFRTAQNARAWPRLEEGAGALLSETTDGRYADVRLSHDYKLVIVDRGEEHGLERYSGGEQDLANLCLRLAIADWVAHERGAEVGFVVLDEVFGSQDEERRRRLVDELRSLANHFPQLLVITHAPDVAELCDHQIRVSLDEPGRSVAELTPA